MKEPGRVKSLEVGLSHLAERGLEVVGLQRHVIVVGHRRSLRLRHGVFIAFGIGAAVIHVISRQVGARAEFAYSQGQYFVARDVYSPVISGHHATTQLAGEVGVLQVLGFKARVLVGAESLCGDNPAHPCVLHHEGLGIISRHVSELTVPESVGIVAV